MGFRRYIPILITLVLVILVQVILSLSDTLYYLTQLTMAAYYALLVVGLCLLMGFAGQISLGHAGFFAIGGYTSAVISTQNFITVAERPLVQTLQRWGLLVERQDLYGSAILSLTPWIAFLSAVLLSIVIAFLIGLPVIRLKGHYMAMATLGFGVIIYRIVLGTEFLGEADGISDVPGFELIPGLEVTGSLSSRVQNYYIAWAVVLLAVLVGLNLIHSRVGRALRSIHGSEEAANAMGINTARYKLNTFVLSAVFAAVGGALLTHYTGGIGPSEATVAKSIRYVAIVAVGGMTNLWGVLGMAILLNFLSLRGYLGSFDEAFFGAMLVAMMVFTPRDIAVVRRLLQWFKGPKPGIGKSRG